jgi:hypothetical protein
MTAAGFAICRTSGFTEGEKPGSQFSLTDNRLSVDILRGNLVAEVAIAATVKPEHGFDLSHVAFHFRSFEALNANSPFKAPYFEMYVAVEQNNFFRAVYRQ